MRTFAFSYGISLCIHTLFDLELLAAIHEYNELYFTILQESMVSCIRIHDMRINGIMRLMHGMQPLRGRTLDDFPGIGKP